MLKYKQDTTSKEDIMPNHCYNRVTFSRHSDSSVVLEQISELKKIFTDENTFTQIIPEPDWHNTPLMSNDQPKLLGKIGELPQYDEGAFGKTLKFQSTGQQDDRWYDWRIQNWDTKWDCYDVEVTDDDPECLEITFNTAWSPPEAICHALRDQYPDINVSWFYDEPGCEIAGYL